MANVDRSFAPINQIHQHLCGLHLYAHDPSRSVEAHHYCTHRNESMHQCVIYDSDEKGARLIGELRFIPLLFQAVEDAASPGV